MPDPTPGTMPATGPAADEASPTLTEAGASSAGASSAGTGSAEAGSAEAGAGYDGAKSAGIGSARAGGAEADEAGEAGAGFARPDERTSMRLLGVVGGLVLAVLAGFGLGRITSGGVAEPAPLPAATGANAVHTDAPGVAPHTHGGTSGGVGTGVTVGGNPAAGDVGGLMVGSADFRLVPAEAAFPAPAARAPFRFVIQAADGTPVTDFAVVHDERLHLIVVRRDMSGYQHLHPVLAPDGTWSTELALPAAGAWRAFADFTATTATGAQVATTLGVDLSVGGDYAATALPAPAPKVTVGGFEVEMAGTPALGSVQPMIFTVRRGGETTQPERYLGAYGHLVVLREGDLGYVHVHPEDRLTVDGAVKFWLAAPSKGRYRAFFDFQVDGAVHTAAFTITIG
ncbi:hypothetical protein J2S43_007586 [Catenuloplanes nepalensis]|uniref:Secreted protein n=1 Tax=Catenuloplanes nepalensis TaxID=587533 RepID=A0ABT9N5U8_9ACTN|nr:hypothetical protein [Catenuloplanes nepalensis]MDP9799074.1 hypothetical protein [Catenuloplanes nepalensis]